MQCAFRWSLAGLPAAEVTTSRFQDRPARTIRTERLRVTVLEGGGHVAEIVLLGGEPLNPLWVQSRPTIDPYRYNPVVSLPFEAGRL